MPEAAPKLKVAIVLGSTRPGRRGEQVAKWVLETAQKRSDAEFALVDLEEFHLPLLDEPIPASAGRYAHAHTLAWAKTVAGFDAFVFVVPEYNHSISGALKNAIDYLYAEWNNKVAGFVGYGSVGGVRAIEHLRAVMAELQIATVRAQLSFSLLTDFEQYTTFKAPPPARVEQLTTLLDQLVAWGKALRSVRAPKA